MSAESKPGDLCILVKGTRVSLGFNDEALNLPQVEERLALLEKACEELTRYKEKLSRTRAALYRLNQKVEEGL